MDIFAGMPKLACCRARFKYLSVTRVMLPVLVTHNNKETSFFGIGANLN